MNRSPLRAFLVIPFVLACFALSPSALAVTPAPDGGYPGNNTAEGGDALFSLTAGVNNTAIGAEALYLITSGQSNTAIGQQALHQSTTGNYNTALGFQTLWSNTIGVGNTALGSGTLWSNTIGNYNTAVGYNTLGTNTVGEGNVAIGADALISSTAGSSNVAVGNGTLDFNTTGSENTAVGVAALQANTSGNGNIALGKLAGANLTTGKNNIDIGNQGVAGESGTLRIGAQRNQNRAFMAGISGATVAGGVGVIIDTNGHLGTVVSSERFKDSIQPMDKASEAILSLRPVTFRYKPELDPEGVPQFGLVAEEVKKVDPDLVARDERGKPYTVRYDAVNAMLLNEFLKEHREVGEQGDQMTDLKAIVAEQQKEIQALTASLKAQAAQIQKVSDQLELSRPAPRTVVDNH